jgi:hypothetical protein
MPPLAVLLVRDHRHNACAALAVLGNRPWRVIRFGRAQLEPAFKISQWVTTVRFLCFANPGHYRLPFQPNKTRAALKDGVSFVAVRDLTNFTNITWPLDLGRRVFAPQAALVPLRSSRRRGIGPRRRLPRRMRRTPTSGAGRGGPAAGSFRTGLPASVSASLGTSQGKVTRRLQSKQLTKRLKTR